MFSMSRVCLIKKLEPIKHHMFHEYMTHRIHIWYIYQHVGISFVCEMLHAKQSHLSNEKKRGCLGYIGDFTTQLYRDYNKPL